MKARKAMEIKSAKVINSKINCFSTWPFGHIWGAHPSGLSYERQCVICSTQSTRGQYDSDWKFDLLAT